MLLLKTAVVRGGICFFFAGYSTAVSSSTWSTVVRAAHKLSTTANNSLEVQPAAYYTPGT